MAVLVSSYIQHWTYFGLFMVLALCGMGLPVPEDVALLTGGYLAHRGIIQYTPTLVVSMLGVVVGDNSLFLIGRRFGTGFVAYLGVGRPNSQRRIARMKGFMDRHGHMAIFYARFLAGVRALVYLTAGSFGVSPARFFVFDALGAVISVPIVVSLGYVFGPEIGRIVHYIGGVEHLVWVVVVGAVLVLATRILWLGRERSEADSA